MSITGNNGPNPRSGSVLIAGHTLIVEQAGAGLLPIELRIEWLLGPPASVRLRFLSQPSVSHQLLKTLGPSLDSFTPFGTPRTGTGGWLEASDSPDPGGRAFYRIQSTSGP